MSAERIFLFAWLVLGGIPIHATQFVSESPPFSLNLDGRPSIADTASMDYVLWLTEFFTIEDLFDVLLVAEESDADFDGKTNRSEYLAASNPVSGNQDFRIAIIDGESRSIEISPLEDSVFFLIEKSADLENWTNLESNAYEKENQSVRILIEPTSERVYYRIRFLDRGPSF